MKRTNQSIIQNVILLLAAVSLWLVFYPGILSYDSLQQYAQAQAWNFNDWHPPLMAVTLGVVIKLGGDVGLLTLAACVLGLFGIRAVIGQLSGQSGWPATIAALCFLLPITPLPIYLVLFWKDTWLAIAMLWLVAGLARLKPDSRRLPLAIAALASLLPLIRHNAAVLLPVVTTCLWVKLAALPRLHRAAFTGLPIVAAFIVALIFPALFGVRRTFVSNAVKEVELSELCTRWPGRCVYPYSAAHKTEQPWKADLQDHAKTPTLWGRSAFEPNEQLNFEYQKALREQPLLIAQIKLQSFYRQLHWQDRYLFQEQTDQNEFGLQLNSAFSKPRAYVVAAITRLSKRQWVTRTIYHHLVWFLLAHLLLAFLLISRRWPADAILLLPISYYYSYLLAATVADFRLMYPSTLCVQTFTVARLLLLLAAFKATPHPPNCQPSRMPTDLPLRPSVPGKSA